MKRYKNTDPWRKAQALLVVLLLLFVAGILSAGAARLFQTESRIVPLQQQGMAAFYLAQAGIERAKIEALYGHWGFGSTTSAWQDMDSAGNFIYRYRYTIVNPGGGSTERTLTGEGQVVNKDDTSQVYAVRQIEVIVEGIEDIAAPIGEDDNEQGAVKPWSWKEI